MSLFASVVSRVLVLSADGCLDAAVCSRCGLRLVNLEYIEDVVMVLFIIFINVRDVADNLV
jgi:hypothetical protein